MYKLERKKGFTLIEILITLAIVAIVLSIAIAGSVHMISTSKEKVCEVNREQLRKDFDYYCITNNMEPGELVADVFIREYGEPVCPSNGTITYKNGQFLCSIHREQPDDEDDNEVPYLKNSLLIE